MEEIKWNKNLPVSSIFYNCIHKHGKRHSTKAVYILNQNNRCQSIIEEMQ